MSELGHWGLSEVEVARILEQTGSMGNPCHVCLQLAKLLREQNSELSDQLHTHALGCANGRLLLTYYYEEPPTGRPGGNA